MSAATAEAALRACAESNAALAAEVAALRETVACLIQRQNAIEAIWQDGFERGQRPAVPGIRPRTPRRPGGHLRAVAIQQAGSRQ